MRTLAFAITLLMTTASVLVAQRGDWLAYGHDQLGGRFSPLAQIDRRQRVAPRGRVDVSHRRSERVHAAAGEVRGDAARRRRNDVSLDAVRPSDRARSRDGARAMDLRRARSTTTATGATSRIAASRRGSTQARRLAPRAGAASTSRTIDARIIALDAKTGAVLPRLRHERDRLAPARPSQLAVLHRGVSNSRRRRRWCAD